MPVAVGTNMADLKEDDNSDKKKDANVIVTEALKLKVTQKDHGNIVKVKPLLSFDSRHILVAAENSINVFSTASQNLVQQLIGHKHKIVNIVPHMWINGQYLSCDNQGYVFTSVPREGKIEKLKKLDIPRSGLFVSSFVAPRNQDSWFVSCDEPNYKRSHLYHVLPLETQLELVTEIAYSCKKKFAVASDATFVVAICQDEDGADRLLVCRQKIYGTLDQISRHFIDSATRKHTRHMTVVACHPSEHTVATGENDGRIVLWFDMLKSDTPVKTVLHWHSLSLADLAFSHNGGELYSGGGESVLVMWQLKEERRRFLPRLGLPIEHVSLDLNNEVIVTSHVDNSLQVISANEFKLKGLIQGLGLSTDRLDPFPAGLVYDPRSESLVLNSRPGHIQFYDPEKMALRYHVDITMTNLVSHHRNQKLNRVDVERLAISTDGRWLATVEYREEESVYIELRLKFWEFVREKRSFVLNTSIELPHDSYIRDICFQPVSLSPHDASTTTLEVVTPKRKNNEQNGAQNGAANSDNEEDEKQEKAEERKRRRAVAERSPLCATAAADGKIKLWSLIDDTDIYRENDCWNCSGLCYFRKHSAHAVCFAPDGSLLAAAFDHIITFWDPKTCRIKGTFSQPYLTQPISQLEFGLGPCSNLLVSRTPDWLCVWDTTSCSLRWRVAVSSTHLVRDPRSTTMAIFTTKGELHTFVPSRCSSVYQQKIADCPVLGAAFVPRVQSRNRSQKRNTRQEQTVDCFDQSVLYFMDSTQTLRSVEPADNSSTVDILEATEGALGPGLGSTQPKTPFASLVAKTRVTDTVPTTPAGGRITYADPSVAIEKMLAEVRVSRMGSMVDTVRRMCLEVLPPADMSSYSSTSSKTIGKFKKVEEDSDSDEDVEGQPVEGTKYEGASVNNITGTIIEEDQQKKKAALNKKLRKKKKKHLASIEVDDMNDLVDLLIAW